MVGMGEGCVTLLAMGVGRDGWAIVEARLSCRVVVVVASRYVLRGWARAPPHHQVAVGHATLGIRGRLTVAVTIVINNK